ncbi:MAG: group II intron reverse transcriptase/maturase [Planctomycetes bacterium]|nr:group II intron reverse transcriptase/maturase [Planctomycetota bacterium]
MIVKKTQHMPEESDKVRVLQRKLYVAAKKEPKRIFGILYDKLHRMDVLIRAWNDVRQKKGSAGIDKVTIQEVERQGVLELLFEIQSELIEERYRPPAVRRVLIPKPGKNGAKRPLGIPTVKDRIVQTATKLVIEPLFEASFLDCSFGFRPKKNPHQAHAQVQRFVIGGYREVVDVDLKSYFTMIPHERLMLCVKKRVRDPKVLRLIKRWLKAGILDNGQYVRTVEGVPQGGPLSPLLSNIYLHVIDKVWTEKYPETTLVRYADDLRLLCKRQSKEYMEKLSSLLNWHGLKINQEKSQAVHARDGFDFLGQHFRLKPSRKWKGWQFCYRWPSKKAMNSIKEKIRNAIGYDDIYSLEDKIGVVNPIIRGWCQYHHYSNAAKHFHVIDSYVYTKFVGFMRRKHRWRGSGYRKAPRSFFEKLGLYHLHGKIRRWPLKATV